MENEKSLGYMALAHKGNMIALGEEPVGAAARAGHARLVVVAGNASDHTWRRAQSFVRDTDQQCIRVSLTKEEMGFVVGRTSLAVAAFTDAALALAFVKALPQPEKYKDVVEDLTIRSKRAAQRRAEAKAHKKNVRMGHRKSVKKS